MTDPSMTDKVSLLPGNLSDLERDLDIAIARIEDINIPIGELWDPWNCPLDALPFLAWALSVDQWRSDWSETVKRQVVAGSLDVHRIKGTRPAVERALADLGVTVDLVEWFQAQPLAAPYTFDITAWVNQNITPGAPSILGPELYEQLFAAVVNAKNTRSGFTLKIGAGFSGSDIAAISLTSGIEVERRATELAQQDLNSGINISAAPSVRITALARTEMTPTAYGPVKLDALPSHILTAAHVSGHGLLKVKMEAIT